MPASSPPLPPDAGRIVARLARQVETALADVDLSPSQYRVLGFLGEDGDAAATALAGRMAVSKPSITALIDGLVQRGYVERRPSASDRRRVEHVVTPTGRAAFERADDAVNAKLAELVDRLDPDDQIRAGEGLAPWGEALTRARIARFGPEPAAADR